MSNKFSSIYVIYTILIHNTSGIKTEKITDQVKVLEEHVIVTDIKMFPYMVAILKKSIYISAGALIDEKWVLTGADSLYLIRESSRILRIRLGSVNYKKGGYLMPIRHFEIHPYFDDSKPLFDVALIKLSMVIKLTPNLNPIRLLRRQKKIAASHFIVISWPKHQLRNQSSTYVESEEQIRRRRVLTVSYLHPTDPEVCSEEVDMLVPHLNNTNIMMCLDPLVGSDPCERDIGAPVVLNGKLWGILSSWKSEDCDIEGGLSFVTLVSAVEINSWIHSTIHGHRWTRNHSLDYEDNFI